MTYQHKDLTLSKIAHIEHHLADAEAHRRQIAAKLAAVGAEARRATEAGGDTAPVIEALHEAQAYLAATRKALNDAWLSAQEARTAAEADARVRAAIGQEAPTGPAAPGNTALGSRPADGHAWRYGAGTYDEPDLSEGRLTAAELSGPRALLAQEERERRRYQHRYGR